jgi:hypothetical protein
LVLETVFDTADGRVALIDFMPIGGTSSSVIRLIRRRKFITLLGGVAATWPLVGRAQQQGRVWRIGYLRAAPPPERNLQAFLRALAEKDYVQGQNFVLITQWGDGRIARLAELAVALVNAGVDVIVNTSPRIGTLRRVRKCNAQIVILGKNDRLLMQAIQAVTIQFNPEEIATIGCF